MLNLVAFNGSPGTGDCITVVRLIAFINSYLSTVNWLQSQIHPSKIS